MTRLIFSVPFFTVLLSTLVFSSYSFAFDDVSSATFKEVPKEFKNAEVVVVDYLNPYLNKGIIQKSFPSQKAYPYDPINKKLYEKSLVGKSYAAGLLAPYTHWRYVTVYDVEEISELISYLPYYEEECYDDSFHLANWGESKSLRVTLRSEIGSKFGVDAIGLSSSISMSIEQGITFSTTRSIKATKGLKARHYPYKRSETWVGKTWIQTYNAKTGAIGYLLPSIWQDFFESYPFDFELDNQHVGFIVKREVLEYCESSTDSSSPSTNELQHLIR